MKPANPLEPEDTDRTEFEQQVNAKSRRKVQARREGDAAFGPGWAYLAWWAGR